MDPRHRPAAGTARGWADAAKLAALPGDTPLGQAATEPLGHAFTVGTDSLRAALDAAVLSPAGQAVGVDEDGRVLGVATFDQLRAAIQAARPRGGRAAGRPRRCRARDVVLDSQQRRR